MTDATAGKIPHILVIMDGVGHREAVEDNAFLAAKRPNLTAIQDKHPHGLISGSGEDVGLPDGQMGNSEVGHMNLGAGRVLYQDFTRITKDIVRATSLNMKFWSMQLRKPKLQVGQYICLAFCLKVVCTPMKIILWRWQS